MNRDDILKKLRETATTVVQVRKEGKISHLEYDGIRLSLAHIHSLISENHSTSWNDLKEKDVLEEFNSRY